MAELNNRGLRVVQALTLGARTLMDVGRRAVLEAKQRARYPDSGLDARDVSAIQGAARELNAHAGALEGSADLIERGRASAAAPILRRVASDIYAISEQDLYALNFRLSREATRVADMVVGAADDADVLYVED